MTESIIKLYNKYKKQEQKDLAKKSIEYIFIIGGFDKVSKIFMR